MGGFFFNRLVGNVKPIKEAEVDGENLNNEAPSDYTETEPQGGEQPPVENNPEPPQEDAPQNEPPADDGQQPPPEEDQPTDYTEMPMDDGGEGGEQEPPPEQPAEEEQPIDDIKQQEEEMYSNLTPEQLDIKHKELKNQYLNMYDMIVSIMQRISDAIISEDSVQVIKYVSESLSDLKDMLSDYVNSVYKTKSYIENLINYNRFMATLNGINKILEELGKKED